MAKYKREGIFSLSEEKDTFQFTVSAELQVKYKSNEMEVHASSKHLTRSDFYLYEVRDTYNMVFI